MQGTKHRSDAIPVPIVTKKKSSYSAYSLLPCCSSDKTAALSHTNKSLQTLYHQPFQNTASGEHVYFVQKTLNSTLGNHQDLYCQQIYDCFREHVLRQRLHAQRQALASVNEQVSQAAQYDFKDGSRPSLVQPPVATIQTLSQSSGSGTSGECISDE